jgi:tRNA threonylcarbamoyladenosine biosynthesis protein TsaE
MQIEYSLQEIKDIARRLWELERHRQVWAFHGEMGSGKTTFIHALCEVLGVTSAIGSPTYSIINEYKSPEAGVVYHLDLYRLRDEEEAMQAGVEDVLYSGNLCLVEWPEKAPSLLPVDCLHVQIHLLDETNRRLTFGDHG